MWGYRHWFIITFPFLCRKNQDCNYFVFSLQVFPGALCRLSLSNNSIIFYFNFSRSYIEAYRYCSSAFSEGNITVIEWVAGLLPFQPLPFSINDFLIFYAIAKKKSFSKGFIKTTAGIASSSSTTGVQTNAESWCHCCHCFSVSVYLGHLSPHTLTAFSVISDVQFTRWRWSQVLGWLDKEMAT